MVKAGFVKLVTKMDNLTQKGLNLKLNGLTAQILNTVWLCLGAFLLSGSVMFSQCAPFGVAFVTVTGNKKNSTVLTLTAAAGYLIASGKVNVIKYLVALLLVWIFRFYFDKIDFIKEGGMLMPFIAGASVFGSGMVFVFVGGFLTYDILMLWAETALCMGGAYIFAEAVKAVKNISFKPRLTQEENICLFISVYLCLLSVFGLSFGDFSIGRMIGVATIILVVRTSNISMSAILGMIFGLVAATAGSDSAILIAVYGLGALVGSFCRERGQIYGNDIVPGYGLACDAFLPAYPYGDHMGI